MAFTATKSINLVKASIQYASIAGTYGLTSWQAFTVEVWVNFASLPPSTGTHEVLTIGWATIGARVRFTNTGGIYFLQGFRHAWSTDTTFIDSAVPLTSGQWHHVALSKDASNNAKLYFDGVIVAAGNLGAGVGATVTANSTVGAGYNNGTLGQFPWDGNISLHRVWGVVRTPDEIKTSKCTIFGSAQTNMRAEHSLDNVYTDASGNAYTLTGVNTPTFTSLIPSICEASLGSVLKKSLRPRPFAPGISR